MDFKKLKDLRVRTGVSQWEVSLKTGISRYKLSQFENGYGRLSDRELMALNDFLVVAAQTIATLSEEAFGGQK